MKLIYCTKCQDIIRLWDYASTCRCEQSGGWYEKDGNHAEIWGSAIPIGIDNISFKCALALQQVHTIAICFDAFFIEEPCKTVKKRR